MPSRIGPMLLAIDIGNTNIVGGIFDGPNLLTHWRLATDPKTTADEYGVLCLSVMARSGRVPEQITGAIISSVVPALTETFESMVETSFRCTPIIVSSEMDTGLTLKYLNPKEIGSDRIVNAAAAFRLYGGPLIIVDFGTATTFCAITKNGDYLGGAICPGVKISSEALYQRAPKLPRVELVKPANVIGSDTISAMQSGIIFGYAGLVDGIVGRMKEELSANARVVATGGLAELVIPETKTIQEIIPHLTLEGLRLLFKLNH